jgi:ABC-type Fe3+-hydroxamate transport system substrate-binding protein
MRYVDALEREVRLKSPPRRVVSLVPSLTEALFAFGVGDAVVGVTNFCVEPRDAVAGKTRVGGTKTLDVPGVLALEPDLVVASAEENRKEDIQALVREGLKVYVTLPTTVAGALDLLDQLAAMTGAGRAAERIVAGGRKALAEVQAANDGRPPVRTFCPIWRNPWMTIGPGTYTHDFIAVCGGANIFEWRHERYPRVELREVAEKDPQVVLLPDEPYRFGPKHVSEITGLGSISAVRGDRIYLLEGRHLCWYGPRIAAGLRYVSSLLAGGALEGATG